MKTRVFSAYNDHRFKPGRHFILSEVNAELVKKCGLDMTVTAFRELVRQTRPAFHTHTGNKGIAPLMRVNVYDINAFKEGDK